MTTSPLLTEPQEPTTAGAAPASLLDSARHAWGFTHALEAALLRYGSTPTYDAVVVECGFDPTPPILGGL